MTNVLKISEREAEVTNLNTAFAELSGDIFALWIRLMTVPRAQLHLGRASLARYLGLHERTCNRRLRLLRLAGYVRLIPGKAGGPTRIVLIKRAAIIGENHFARL